MSHALVIHRLKFSPSRATMVSVDVVVVAMAAGATSPAAHW